MLIPSINCTRSSTYVPNGTELSLRWAGYIWGEGIVSNDTITVGDGLHIQNQPFLEAYTSSTSFFGGLDTILGLAINKPLWAGPDDPAQHQLPSPFSVLAKQGTLDRNVVSILLPYSDADLGDILFGDIDSSLYHEGTLTTHALYPPGIETWQIEASSVTIPTPDGLPVFHERIP